MRCDCECGKDRLGGKILPKSGSLAVIINVDQSRTPVRKSSNGVRRPDIVFDTNGLQNFVRLRYERRVQLFSVRHASDPPNVKV